MTSISRRQALLAAAATAGAAGAAGYTGLRNSNALRTEAPGVRKKIGIVIFPGFETLDVFGPVEMWGRLPDHEIVMVSERGGEVKSAQGVTTVASCSFATAPQFAVLMVPGGDGTEAEVNNPAMLAFLRKQDRGTEWTVSVCTGAAILASAKLLDGRKATTNKRSFHWVAGHSAAVQWQGRARWVMDGKYVTSSGVSAGMDMALALVENIYGRARAEENAALTEYVWSRDPGADPFAAAA